MIKPLPCPFCQMIPDVVPQDPEKESYFLSAVKCDNPECVAKPIVLADYVNIDLDRPGSDEYKKLAILRWNKALEWTQGSKQKNTESKQFLPFKILNNILSKLIQKKEKL